MSLEDITNEACKLAMQAGDFIKQQSYKRDSIVIEEKDRNSLVSYVDKTAEALLVDGLGKITPGCGFITEEDTPDVLDKEWEWIIDPLDGTTNFLWGVPVYSVSLGLKRDGKLVAGVVYEINRNELFYAHTEGNAYLNNRQIKVSTRPKLSQSLLATGFPYTDYSGIEAYMNTLKYLMENSRGLRRMGSAAVDLAYVACGRFEGFFEYGLNPWDVAGGAVIIQQAGGTVTDFSDGDGFLFGRQIIATNGLIHPELKDALARNFEE